MMDCRKDCGSVASTCVICAARACSRALLRWIIRAPTTMNVANTVRFPVGDLMNAGRFMAHCGVTNFASRSTRGTITLTRFLTLMFARPPRGVPVIAKNPVVVAFGGTMPEASAIDA